MRPGLRRQDPKEEGPDKHRYPPSERRGIGGIGAHLLVASGEDVSETQHQIFRDHVPGSEPTVSLRCFTYVCVCMFVCMYLCLYVCVDVNTYVYVPNVSGYDTTVL